MLNIFLLSFIVALTGALSPGPVLTFTIYKSLQGKRGYLAGFFIILGHAILEAVLIILLLLGVSVFLRNIVLLTIIGIVGGIILVIFGIMGIRSLQNQEFEVDFSLSETEVKGFKGNSVVGGILLSLSNPYWTFWWAVAGVSLMINLNISFENPLGILVFFLGHELGDFLWYIPISVFVYLGGKSLNASVYKKVIIASALFMIGFGVYLALKTIIVPPI